MSVIRDIAEKHAASIAGVGIIFQGAAARQKELVERIKLSQPIEAAQRELLERCCAEVLGMRVEPVSMAGLAVNFAFEEAAARLRALGEE